MPQAVMTAVSPQRAKQTVESLAGFGTRHTLSATDDPARGIGAAREWLRQQFVAAGPRLQVSLEEFDAPKSPRLPEGGKLVNVVAVLPGTDPVATKRRYYVVGHYDSMNGDRMDPTGDAPGANDDASGCAVVLECARALAKQPLEATVVFLCTAAEEQGLVGASLHAQAAKARGEQIVGVLNCDIVGDPSPALVVPANAEGTDFVQQSARTIVRVFSEGLPRSLPAEELARLRQFSAESDSASRQLARFIFTVAAREETEVRPWIIFRPDRFLRGGDHSAFNDAGFPAARFTAPAEDYSRQHQNVTERDGKPYGDVAEFVDGEYIAGVARLNAVVLTHLAMGPSAPARARLLTAQLTPSTQLRWDTAPEADVAGYEVVWRTTTAWQWEGARDVGKVTQLELPMSKDNFFFGVRAYDIDGYRSLVSFAGAAGE